MRKKNEEPDERNRRNKKRKQGAKEEKQGFQTTIERKNSHNQTML